MTLPSYFMVTVNRHIRKMAFSGVAFYFQISIICDKKLI